MGMEKGMEMGRGMRIAVMELQILFEHIERISKRRT